MPTREHIAEILLDINAVSLSAAIPFKYASGILSPIYTDCRLLASYPMQRKAIVDSLVEHVHSRAIKADIIVGTGSSAISLATHVAQRLGLPMAYVRPTAKSHGKEKQIEGVFKQGYKALLISDIISTERDIANSIQAIQECGGDTIYCLAIFSNNLGIIEDLLDKHNIPYHSLTDLRAVLAVASREGRLAQDESACVEEWMANPEDWAILRRRRLEDDLQKTRKNVASILLKIGAVAIRTDSLFRYASGMRSPVYTDNRLLLSYPEEWKYVISCLVNQVVNGIGVQNVDRIAGIATSGIAHAAYLADRLGLPMAYVKSKAEDYGKRTKIEGVVSRGDRVLLIEDLVTTGNSAISAARTLEEAGACVRWCLAIFSYGLRETEAAFSSANVALLTLSDLDSLLEVGVATGQIEPVVRDLVTDWRKEPSGWAERQTLGGSDNLEKLQPLS